MKKLFRPHVHSDRLRARPMGGFFDWFVQSEVSSSVILVFCAAIAMIWVNSPWSSSYKAVLESGLSFQVAGNALSMNLHQFVNDCLMTVFFLVVGLEIRREMVRGELSSPRKAALPLLAALGGMVVPALVYTVLNVGNGAAHGWGVPMATDIAFSLGVLALLGNRIPVSLKVFLTALAIADDLGAVLVIALFYGGRVSAVPLLVALALLVAIVALGRVRIRSVSAYLLLGLGVWVAVYASGIHATVAGVLVAFALPLSDDSLEHALQPWSSYLILPIFALFNAGVALSGAGASAGVSVAAGVFFGLLIGKPLGVMSMSMLAVRLGIAQPLEGVSNRLLFGTAWLTGIGFTMSLFIAELAFDNPALIEQAKRGIIFASLAAGVVGYLVLRTATTPRAQNP